jgi:hypothetical protein
MNTPPNSIRAHIHPDLFPIGNIEDGTGEEIAAAEAWLKGQGCTHARGPMGRTTWSAYRAVVETDGRAPFLGEPTFSPDVWISRGYTPCAHYASAVADNIEQADAVVERSNTLASAGWEARGLDAHATFDNALQCFHRISSAAFTKAYSYTPISLDQFRSMYGPIEGMLDPRMVLTAFNPNNEPLGFCFTIPDRLNPQSKQFIIKTLAVDPTCHQLGIGSWLTGVAHDRAHQLGWTHGGIHALMWTGSHSRTISKTAATIFRRYALFEKTL